jgi:nicotinate-nucleotide adenylyltransferase
MSAPVGIFGGTFDPVHYGHLRAAVEVCEALQLAELRMVVSARPPHRAQPVAPAGHRLEMLRLVTASRPELVADDSEMRREGSSFMVDTLEGFRKSLGEVPLVLVIGQDAANGLDRWHQWRRLFDLAHIAVMRRPDSVSDYTGELAEQMTARAAPGAAELQRSPAGRVLPLDITQLEISATAIRDLIAAERSPVYLTPPPVIEYIRRHGLYG